MRPIAKIGPEFFEAQPRETLPSVLRIFVSRRLSNSRIVANVPMSWTLQLRSILHTKGRIRLVLPHDKRHNRYSKPLNYLVGQGHGINASEKTSDGALKQVEDAFVGIVAQQIDHAL